MFLKYSKKYKSLLFIISGFLLALGFGAFLLTLIFQKDPPNIGEDIITFTKDVEQVFSSPTPTLAPPPNSYEIPLKLHVFQSFNNCGPATLSMALSYEGINKNQEELGQILRPYQIPGGDNDDKSVTLKEVAAQAETYGLTAYLRPNGDIEKLKQFIAYDIPVVTRTWLQTNEDIGHYRIIRGYDGNTQEIIQDDSLQGKNLRFSYNEFNALWQPFNYEYLVLIPENKMEAAKSILDEELDEKIAWENAKVRIENELTQNPSNSHLIFALSRIHYYLGNYDESIRYFNSVENTISTRTLWYQIEPLLSIYETGDYNRVFQIADKILNNQNRAYSELYKLKGDIYLKQGRTEAARAEYEKAVVYNSNFASKIPAL